jgi:hypothetical protein
MEKKNTTQKVLGGPERDALYLIRKCIAEGGCKSALAIHRETGLAKQEVNKNLYSHPEYFERAPGNALPPIWRAVGLGTRSKEGDEAPLTSKPVFAMSEELDKFEKACSKSVCTWILTYQSGQTTNASTISDVFLVDTGNAMDIMHRLEAMDEGVPNQQDTKYILPITKKKGVANETVMLMIDFFYGAMHKAQKLTIIQDMTFYFCTHNSIAETFSHLHPGKVVVCSTVEQLMQKVV